MGKVRGFLLKHRVNTTLLRRSFCRRLGQHRSIRFKPFAGLISWTHRLRTKAKAIVTKNRDSGRDYIRSGQERVLNKQVDIPKGHMAIYVGQKGGDRRRFLVPVLYFNHPFFGDLLKKSEKEYGFDHPGGITIPCQISEFERVQTRIERVRCTRNSLKWWRRPIRRLKGR